MRAQNCMCSHKARVYKSWTVGVQVHCCMREDICRRPQPHCTLSERNMRVEGAAPLFALITVTIKAHQLTAVTTDQSIFVLPK